MFDVGWTELMVIGVVGLVVIGPKELPEMFRTMGRFTAKARSMARDFQRAMEAAADEAGVKDVAKDLKAATSVRSLGLDAVKDAATKFEKWDPLKPAAKPAVKPAAALQPLVAPEAEGDSAAKSAAPMGPATTALMQAKEAKRSTQLAGAPAAATPLAAPVPNIKGEARAKPKADPKPAAKVKPKSTKAATTDKSGAVAKPAARLKPTVVALPAKAAQPTDAALPKKARTTKVVTAADVDPTKTPRSRKTEK